jgi:hypothetical protein
MGAHGVVGKLQLGRQFFHRPDTTAQKTEHLPAGGFKKIPSEFSALHRLASALKYKHFH